MKYKTLILLSTVSLAQLVGCGGGDKSRFERLSNASVEFGESFCTCSDALGIDEEACLESFAEPPYTDIEQDCLDDVARGNAATVDPILDCYVDAIREATDCMNSLVACDEEDFAACAELYGEGVDDCPDYPASLEAQFESCTDDE